MHTPASIARHPIHPMLVTIPVGLWVFSFICDLMSLRVGEQPVWAVVAVYCMFGGIVGALVAAIPGLIDLLSLKQPVRKIALMHMGLNLAVVALYAFNVRSRFPDPEPETWQILLSLATILMLLVSGWLGGKMVYEHRVGVDTPA